MQGKSRPSYDLLDMVRGLRGWYGLDHVAVPKEIFKDIESEIERLYTLDDTLNDIALMLADGVYPTADNEIWVRLGIAK